VRTSRAIGLTTAALIAVLGLPIPAVAAESDTLWVWKSNANCSDNGPGSRTQPFCTIGAAVDTVQPGQTVQLQQDMYVEDVRITRSGTAQAPITFIGNSSWLVGSSATPGPALTVSGAQHVVIRNFQFEEAKVENSTGITLDRNATASYSSHLEIGSGNQDVSVTRSHLWRLQVTGGSTGVVVSNNSMSEAGTTPLSVTGTPGVTITNNTVALGCGPGIALLNGSTGARVYNNIVDSHGTTTNDNRPCAGTAAATELLVSADSAAGSVADYNLLRAKDGGTPYSWAGADYPTPEAFHAATGQGGHDLMGDPKLVNAYGAHLTDCQLVAGKPDPNTCSPAIDSAKSDAPGVLDADLDGHTPVDHPFVANGDAGYLDRGASEVADELSYSTRLTADHTWAPSGTNVTFTAAAGSKWKDTLRYTFDFGDGTAETTSSPTAAHTYQAACACKPKLTVTALGGGQATATLDNAFKVTTPGPLTAQLSTSDVRPTKTDWSADAPLTVQADAANAVAASPWPVTDIRFDFGDDSWKTVSIDGIAKHTYKAPGDYTVTVTLTDYQGRKATASQVHKVRYLAGRYTTVEPYRALDTRTYKNPVSEYLPRTLDLSSWGHPENREMSDGMTAVVLNVTATQATKDTFLTLWPSGQPRPTASNLNIKAGQTVANLVTVPVGYNQSLEIYNHSGSTDVIVDVLGYYQPDTGNRFSSTAPTRLLDTRPMNGTADTKLIQDETREVQVTGRAGVPESARAVVLNLTATQSTTGGYIAAYPHGHKRPGISSLNFTAGQTVANQAIVPIGWDGKIDLYNLRGDTQVIADVVGYYSYDGKGEFMPVAPTRLTDTRPGGNPLGAGGELAVQVGGANGVPSDAIAAVLNVTATQPTAAGFLTVWPDGQPRPGTSSLNFLAGQTVPNHVTAPLGGNGRTRIYNHAGSTHVLADLSGYFTNS